MTNTFHAIFDASVKKPIELSERYASLTDVSGAENQQQTNDVFTEKWDKYAATDELEKFYAFQRDWYLKLYGFDSEAALATHLGKCRIIVDAGCGLGYKAAWFARLAPGAVVVGIDYSGAAKQASELFGELDNLFFLQGDIAKTPFKDGAVDYVSCDQVIMHTESPEATFAELSRITASAGQFACYFYAKKALPRELLDDYFRMHCKEVTSEQLWEMSEQLTELGKRLSELTVNIDVPEIPLLGIKGGEMDIQRFVYWNFLKCFWNEELGKDTSIVTNFDWYSPSNARRFSEDEVRRIVADNGMKAATFHSEEAAYSGRFAHSTVPD
ncbi:methyltransferase domain-containing protein [Altererythrobacter confluentis]|uniref:Methyltransferase domain-containing protein n=1 Tax=Allopontixanthobacter confluentis TaxID=1849021 RepID=A0A6L7GGX5_9SPHN|nr:class I SAM-dependent methyltransferase [Allopontixanthobacter confluentis]MXP15157.1 methyltransferase domain-containing protein [Allopontixanthobacter confluentis]